MKPLEIKKDIYWVGAVDWNSRDFHGYSLSPRGTTYNAYLVKDEKITLFDTVHPSFKGDMFCRLSQLLDGDLTKIDYLVINHLEPDHAGLLPEVVAAAKPEKIFCSTMGLKAMKAHFHFEDWPVTAVKTGDSINIGARDVSFVETRMLHWPDSMSSYIPQDKLLICNDAFGQNIASTERYSDEIPPQALLQSMKEYYANIVLPYSPVVLKTLDAVAAMGIEIDMLAPDHGLIFRGEENVKFALDTYRMFAEQKPKKKAVIVYDSMWKSTQKMADAIASGLEDSGVSVRKMWLKANHHSAVMTEVWDAAAVLVGSPTHNNGIMPNVAALLQYMKGLRPQNKLGGSFGSFGWSGESVKVIQEWLEKMGMEIVTDPVKTQFVPTHETFAKCYEMGKQVAEAIDKKLAE